MTEKKTPQPDHLLTQIDALQNEVAMLKRQINHNPADVYLKAVKEISTLLMQRANVDDLLNVIVQQSAQLADTPHGFIYLLEDDNKMWARAATGLFEPHIGRFMIENRGVVWEVWQTGKPMTISDYDTWSKRMSSVIGEGAFYSAAAFPLKSDDVVLGVLALVYEEHGREFDEQTIALLEGFADLATIALNNTRLYSELNENRQFTQRILDTVPEIVRVYDYQQRRLIFTNNSMLNILGYSEDEIGNLSSEYQKTNIHPDDLAEWKETGQQIFEAEDGEIIELEYRTKNRDGEWRWLHRQEVVFQRDDAGKVTQLLAVIKDITEKKDAERKLKENQQFNEKIAQAIPDIIRIYDIQEDQNYYVNNALPAILGYTTEELASYSFEAVQELMHPDDRALWLTAEHKLKHGLTDDVQEFEYRFKHRDGKWRWVRRRDAIFLYDDDGNPKQYIGIIQDITKQKEAEIDLQRQAHLLTIMNDAVISTDTEFRIESWNSAAETLYGWKSQEVIGKLVSEIIPPEYVDDTNRQEALKTLQSQGTWHGEVIQYHRNGDPLDILSSVTLIKNNEGEAIGSVAVNRDITERKQIEAQSVAYNLEKEKVRMIADFITNVSHDFRTPLSTLNTSLYLLEQNSRPERKQERIDVMRGEIQHLEKLVDGLITMIRLDSHNIAMNIMPMDINSILREVITKVSSRLQAKNLRLGFIEKSDSFAGVDYALFHQALFNLVDNAINFTPEGGAIYLGVQRNDEQNQMLITVRDNGIGIAPNDAPHIFERFYQADKSRSTRRVGLGLPIVKKIAELHNGFIDFESQEGQGSNFTIYLPLETESTP